MALASRPRDVRVTPPPSAFPSHVPRDVAGGRRRTNWPITRSGEGEALDGLASHLGNERKVFIDVQYGQAGELRGGCDEQIRYRCRPVMASLGEHHLDRNGPIFNRGGLVLD